MYTHSTPPSDSGVQVLLAAPRAIAGTDLKFGRRSHIYYYSADDLLASRNSLIDYFGVESWRKKNSVSLYRTPLARKYQSHLKYVISRLVKIGRLERNWDGEGAQPMGWKAAVRALALFTSMVNVAEKLQADLPIPSVSPLPDGSIEFEFETIFREAMVLVPAKTDDGLNYLVVDKSGIQEHVQEGVQSSDPTLAGLVVDWFR
jgi:hypothetical protein